jgi:hypothetical protein
MTVPPDQTGEPEAEAAQDQTAKRTNDLAEGGEPDENTPGAGDAGRTAGGDVGGVRKSGQRTAGPGKGQSRVGFSDGTPSIPEPS